MKSRLMAVPSDSSGLRPQPMAALDRPGSKISSTSCLVAIFGTEHELVLSTLRSRNGLTRAVL